MVTGWIVGVRQNEPEMGVVVGVVAVVVVLPGVLPVVVTVVPKYNTCYCSHSDS